MASTGRNVGRNESRHLVKIYVIKAHVLTTRPGAIGEYINNHCRLIESCISLLQKIDYVLVYSEPELGKENDQEEKEKAEIREKYEENLRKQGLMIEHVTSDEQVCKPAVNKIISFS